MDFFSDLLNKFIEKKEITAWQIRQQKTERFERYQSSGKKEAGRFVRTERLKIILHNLKGDKLQEATLELQPPYADSEEKIISALYRSRMVSNPPWSFSDLSPQISDHSPWYQFDDVRQAVNEMEAELTGSGSGLLQERFASWELFAERIETTVLNSRGLSFSYPENRLLWDYVLLSASGERESGELARARFPHQFSFAEVLQREENYLELLGNAELPQSGKYPVLFSDEARDELFTWYLHQLSGEALYQGYSVFAEGGSVYSQGIDEKYDKVNLSTDPFLSGGVSSAPIDGFGFPLEQRELIVQGEVKDYLIDGKYASLLSKQRTSALSNIVVGTGKMPLSEMRGDGVIELLRFSAFSPNRITGAFSAEIRLGFLYKNGKKIPLRGGAVSGNAREAFSRVYFSAEEETRGSYRGPLGILFENLTIAGKS